MGFFDDLLGGSDDPMNDRLFMTQTSAPNAGYIGNDPRYVPEVASRMRQQGTDYAADQTFAGVTARDNTNLDFNAISQMGRDASAYGYGAAAGIADSAGYLQDQGRGIASLGDAAANRGGPALDFGAQNAALGGAADAAGQITNLNYGAQNDSLNYAAQSGNRLNSMDYGAQNAALGGAAQTANGLNSIDYSNQNALLSGTAQSVGRLANLESGAVNTASALSNIDNSRQNAALGGTADAIGRLANMDYGAQNAALGSASQAYDRLGSMNYGAQNSALGLSQGGASQLGQLEAQQGPSAAQAQLQQGANQSMAQSLALARSGRGFGGSAAAQSGALQQNAATMQNTSNSAAMLRAQEDAAWRQRQAANIGTAAGIQQNAAGQFGNQTAQQAQQIAQQAQLAQQNASQFGQQQAQQAQNLGMSAQLGQANAAQYGQQAAQQAANINALAQVQQQDAAQQAQNLGMSVQLDQASANQYGQQAALQSQNITNLAQIQQQNAAQYGAQTSQQAQQYGMAAQIAQANAAQYGQQNAQQMQGLGMAAQIQQANAAQYGQQQALGAQTALTSRAQNDALQQGLYGLGMTAQNQALGAQTAAGQLGLQGATAGASIYGAGADLALRGEQFAADQRAAGYQGQMQGDAAANMLQIAQNANDQANRNRDVQMYGIDKGVSIAQDQAAAQMTGAVINGLATTGGALLTKSDARAKTNIASASGGQGAAPTLEAAAATRPYSYEYNDPQTDGYGRHYGVMAQDLEKTPAGRAVVREAPDGTKMVDSSKLTMQNTASIGELARELEDLKRTKGDELARAFPSGGEAPAGLRGRQGFEAGQAAHDAAQYAGDRYALNYRRPDDSREVARELEELKRTKGDELRRAFGRRGY